jgi:hypothetical protein
MTATQLQSEINSLPPNLRQEVEDFVAFLKTKTLKEEPKLKKRQFGYFKGKIKMSKDFDEPLTELFKDYM